VRRGAGSYDVTPPRFMDPSYAGKIDWVLVGEILQERGQGMEDSVGVETVRQAVELSRPWSCDWVTTDCAMAEAPPTPGATLRGTGGSVLSSTNGGNHHHIEEDPEPNISTKSAIIYKTSQNPKPEQPLTSRHSSGSRKSKTVSFHSATSLPTERKISSGKLHISPT